jgi:hypothetical protein
MNIERLLVLASCAILLPLAAAAQSPAATTQSSAAASPADTAAPVMAVWVEQTIHFPYMAFTAYYSCDGLKTKVSSILKAIGARPGFKVTARACMNPRNGAEEMPGLDIVAAMPRAATPEVLAQLGRDASQRELAAKAAGKAAPAAEATAEFPARSRRIDFRDSPSGLVQPGDCELVEQLRDRVFVPLGAKVVENRMGCVPHTLNNGIIVLSIEVLEPMPEPRT